MNWQVAIGLEVHVQLNTRSKMFCGCSTQYGEPPNTQVCPVCLGYPGAMPAMNREAIRRTVMTGMMIGSRIPEYSKFDRKSYFYPDMPKNYQISQYDRPLCEGGSVEIRMAGEVRRLGVTRIHLEEDVGKLMHFQHASGVDFNRAGVPLMEIVSEPDMHTPEEALAYLQALKQILQYAGVSDCNLEQGNIRCDVNCSLAPEGSTRLGTKTELKNLNTFKGVQAALRYEITRQMRVLESGGAVVQETRRWDVDAGVTCSMRGKEDAHDYRYFPEPDLMPVALDEATLAAWRAELPELPEARKQRFTLQYGLPEYDAGVLVSDKDLADYFEAAAARTKHVKAVSNWVMTEMLRLLGERDRVIGDVPLTPEALAELVDLVQAGTINSNTAKTVFLQLFEQGGRPGEMVTRQGLAQVSNEGEIEGLVDAVIKEHAKSAEDYRNGKKAAAQFLVGQVMRRSQGKANPKMVAQWIERKLA